MEVREVCVSPELLEWLLRHETGEQSEPARRVSERELARKGEIVEVTRVERFGRTTRVVTERVVRSYRGPVRGE